ncbi:hypothetical protein [Teichococcus aestuarii]|uniref:hypothetical protein n=1 Tax=Teichococcus aestuarii TaxID=568898 RepID=UPI00360E91C1
MHMILRLVPAEQAGTAQALHAALGVGLLMGVFTLLSGPFYAAWGGGVFLLMAGLCALALPLAGACRPADARRAQSSASTVVGQAGAAALTQAAPSQRRGSMRAAWSWMMMRL